MQIPGGPEELLWIFLIVVVDLTVQVDIIPDTRRIYKINVSPLPLDKIRIPEIKSSRVTRDKKYRIMRQRWRREAG